MSTTLEAPPQIKTVFVSVKPGQVITRRPVRKVPNGEGVLIELTEKEWIAREEEAAVESERTQARANDVRVQEGKEPLEIRPFEVDYTPWKVAFGQDHRYEVPQDIPEDAQEKLAAWLRGHHMFNSPTGFYEEGKAPNEPKPTLGEQMTEIAAAAADADLARLEAVVKLERETHERREILVAADAAIAGLSKLAAQMAAGDDEPGEDPDESPATAQTG